MELSSVTINCYTGGSMGFTFFSVEGHSITSAFVFPSILCYIKGTDHPMITAKHPSVITMEPVRVIRLLKAIELLRD
jgi:hypothetical protein